VCAGAHRQQGGAKTSMPSQIQASLTLIEYASRHWGRAMRGGFLDNNFRTLVADQLRRGATDFWRAGVGRHERGFCSDTG
jgi:hypothetical protein